MKTEKSLWTSISILVGTVIMILALIRGSLQVWLLLGVFAVWGGWVVNFLLMPYIKRAKKARIRRAQREQRFQDVFADVEAVHETAPRYSAAETAVMRHVNFRITAYLRSIYESATWEWCEREPVKLILDGGVGRIKVYGVEDFTHADVKVDKNGNIRCSMVKIVPISDIAASESGTPVPPNKQPIDPQIWYETTGRAVLENVIADLNSRGHSQLTLTEGGDIQIEQDNEDISLEQLKGFPEKVYWPRLVKVFQSEGLAAQAQPTGILLSW